MGGHSYLTKLALGRSAFEGQANFKSRAEAIEPGLYVQQYDSKGHSKNERTRALSEEQVEAKNEVLEAVGICERKHKGLQDAVGRRVRMTFSNDEWNTICNAENEVGSDASIIADLSHLAVTWWLSALQGKMQAGLVSTSDPFITILLREWHHSITHGFLHAIRTFSTGAIPEALTSLAVTWAEEFFQIFSGDLRGHIRRTDLSGISKRTLIRYTRHINYTAMALFQLGISALPMFSMLQQLGLYNPRFGFPPLTSFLPWHESSPLQWAWSSGHEDSLFSHRMINLMMSPVSLWISINALRYWIDMNADLFESWEGTALTPLAIEEPVDSNLGVQFVPWSLRPLIHLRSSTTDIPRPSNEKQARPKPRNSYRLTELSLLPSKILGLRLHTLLWQIALLPLDSLLLRSVAWAFVHSSYAQTLSTRDPSSLSSIRVPSSGIMNSATLLATGLYSPFNGSLLVRLFKGQGAKGALGAYTSKIGLMICLQAAVDFAIWGVTWITTRRIGIRRFFWGAT